LEVRQNGTSGCAGLGSSVIASSSELLLSASAASVASFDSSALDSVVFDSGLGACNLSSVSTGTPTCPFASSSDSVELLCFV